MENHFSPKLAHLLGSPLL